MSSVGSTGIQFEISLLAGRVKLSLLAGRVKLPLRGEGLGGVCCPLLMGPEPRYGLGLIGGALRSLAWERTIASRPGFHE